MIIKNKILPIIIISLCIQSCVKFSNMNNTDFVMTNCMEVYNADSSLVIIRYDSLNTENIQYLYNGKYVNCDINVTNKDIKKYQREIKHEMLFKYRRFIKDENKLAALEYELSYATCYYAILLDAKYEVRDVKVLKLFNFDSQIYDIESFLLAAMKENKNWRSQVPVSKCKWHLFFSVLNI